MISVDEEDFLIATDIDKMIDILSTKKDVEVGKLSKELGMNRREVEKWLHVLEEEGVVDLANRMGSLYAIWIMDAPQDSPPQRKKSAPSPAPRLEARETEELPAGIELAEEIGAMRSVSPRPLPARKSKSLFSDIFPANKRKKSAKRKPAPKIGLEGGPEEAGRKPISRAPRSSGSRLPPGAGAAAPLMQELVEEFGNNGDGEAGEGPAPPAPRAKAAPPVSEYSPGIRPEPEARMKKKLEKSEFLKLPRRQTGKLRDRLEDYLKLIRESKGELRSLESEKERIHREGFVSLEKDFEANLESLEYALLEKEKRILEAKERFSSLPEQIEHLGEIQESFDNIGSDARSLLSKTKEDLDSGWNRLQDVGEELSEELSKGEEEALHDRSRMMGLRDMLHSINHAEAQLRETLEASRAAVGDMEEKIRKVEDSLETLSESKSMLSERIDRIRSTLEQRMVSLDDLRGEMENIEKVESWFKEYSKDYEAKIGELQDYVQQSEEELEHVKKAAELEYVKRYLTELDGAEEKYRESLGALEMEEASIDEKIAEARDRIKQLMRESSELMSKYRQMTEEGVEFGEVAAAARSASRSQRRTIEEKASQRKKHLRTGSRGRPPKSKPAKAAPKPGRRPASGRKKRAKKRK